MKNLKLLRESNNLTQQQMADLFGIQRPTYSRYENGERQPDFKLLIDISKHFHVSVDYLLGQTDDKYKKRTAFDDLTSYEPTITEKYTTFPVIGEIAAGYDNIALESWEGDTISIPDDYLKGHQKSDFFVLRVKGDSMYPLYHDGDKVLILKQETLNASGDIGAVIYDDEIATLKKVEYVMGEDWMRLVPINPNIPPMMIEGERLEHCRVIGIPRLLIREIN